MKPMLAVPDDVPEGLLHLGEEVWRRVKAGQGVPQLSSNQLIDDQYSATVRHIGETPLPARNGGL